MFHEFINLQSWIPTIIYGGSSQSIFLNATGLCDFCVVVVFFSTPFLCPPHPCFFITASSLLVAFNGIISYRYGSEVTAVVSLTSQLSGETNNFSQSANLATSSKNLQVYLKIADAAQRNHLPESN